MLQHEKDIREYLDKLGFEPTIADLYFTLYQYGPQTLSELARNSGVERTRIYRLLDKLQGSSLVEIEVHYKRNIYKASPLSNLRVTIAREEQRIKNLKSELQEIEQLLPMDSLNSPTTRVQFYHGKEGLKQMLWNQTKAKTEVLATLHENMQQNTGAAFFQYWVDACNKNGRLHRGIVGDGFMASQKKWYGSTKKRRLLKWEGRYIRPSIFPIEYSQVIYNNVVTFYNWQGKESYGIEIHNKQIATAHRYFFKAYWQLAQPLEDGEVTPRE